MLGSTSSSSYEPYALGIPNCAATTLPFSRLRDAMASNWMYLPFCMAGITLPVPILAVLRTPQRTLFMRLFLSLHGLHRINWVAAFRETGLFRLVDAEACDEFVAQGFERRDIVDDQFGSETVDVNDFRVSGFHHLAERFTLIFRLFGDLVGKDSINGGLGSHHGNLRGG